MSGLTVGSLFSGVGGFEQGFEQAGFRTAWQCEIDPDATSVLERHWPDVRRFKDVREIAPADLEPVDVVTGGFPCQPFSVAGNRQGQDDERYLFPEILRIVEGMREATNGRYPAIVVLENVPGLFSGHGGRDFAAVLAGLSELGAAVAYRVLDAQFFGVAQRRRRVFIVADFAEPDVGERRAASILSLFESVRGDSPAGSEARQGAARDAANGAGSGGPVGYHENLRDVYPYSIAPCLPTTGLNPTRPGGFFIPTTAYTLAASARGTGDGHGNAWNSTYVPMSGEAVAHCLTAHEGSHGRIDAESETFVVAVDGQSGASSPLVGTLCSDQGTAGGFMVAAFDERQITSKANRSTVERGARSATLNGGAGMSVVGFTNRGLTTGDTAHETLRAASHGAIPMAQSGMSVRRLMPVECERLMGWPDDLTRWRADGREIPDGPRYRMCGNGVVAPVAFWLARRVRAALEAS